MKVINRKVNGKIPVEEYYDIRDASIHNTGSDSMTLGKWMDGKVSYLDRAKDKGSMFFDLGEEWGVIQKKYGLDDADMFEIFNKPALDDAIRSGKTIRFSHDPRLLRYSNSALADEWQYLRIKGYKILEPQGGSWIAK